MTTYKALLGRRRVFFSLRDAQAYDRGVMARMRGAKRPLIYGPEHDGWIDADMERS